MVTRARTGIRQSTADRMFDVFNKTLMVIFLLTMIYPLWFVLIASVSNVNKVNVGTVILLPQGFNRDSYRYVIQEDTIWRGYRNTIIVTILGVVWHLCLLMPTGYAISKKYLLGRTVIQWFFLFTMFFSGGLIPSYLLFKSMGLCNTLTILWIGCLGVGDMVVVRTYFQSSIPDDLYESADIDGATDFQKFFKIALPLAKPIIAVETLYIAVWKWNDFYTALIYITKGNYFPLQLVLRNVLLLNQSMLSNLNKGSNMSEEMIRELTYRAKVAEAMKYSIIYIASAPMLIAYPFVQKYFVKGIMVGALKG